MNAYDATPGADLTVTQLQSLRAEFETRIGQAVNIELQAFQQRTGLPVESLVVSLASIQQPVQGGVRRTSRSYVSAVTLRPLV